MVRVTVFGGSPKGGRRVYCVTGGF